MEQPPRAGAKLDHEPAPASGGARSRGSLRGKFVRILLVVCGLLAVANTFIVVLLSARVSARHLADIQGRIEEGIISKGKVLTHNHALALRGLVTDNAFLDMQRLVESAVADDPDLVYGVFVNTERVTLALSRRGEQANSGLPAKTGWRELGLRAADVSVESPRVERVERQGKDLLEVAIPVLSEEGEALGTVRYGLSTARMHEALVRAKQDASADLWRSVLLMAALVAVVAGIGLVLSRAQATRITRPIGELTKAAEALARGDRSVRVEIDSGDELAVLGNSFNRMVNELQHLYRTLEEKVEARTAELALRNRDMRLVLDNVDEGLVTLSPEGVMTAEHSAAVNAWFGEPAPNQSFWHYIGRHSPEFAECFELAWWQLEEGILPLEMCLSQLPLHLTQGERTWSFRYLPIESEGRLDGVLLVIAEITHALAHEREEAEQRELMQAFRALMADRDGLTGFMREAGVAIQAISAGPTDGGEPALKRRLHTLKGNAAVMGFGVVAQLCHELEDELDERGQVQRATLERLQARWNTLRSHVAGFTDEQEQRIEVPVAEYSALLSGLASSGRDGALLKQLLAWRLEPVAKPLTRLAEQARLLARRLDKGDIDVELDVQDVRLDPARWAPFFSELVHLLRNAVDHGLETPGARREAGKPACGRIALKAGVEGSSLVFELGDDGRGIDWGKIAQSARERGLPHTTRAELLRALCSEGVTTSELVSDISGRGVGMASFWEVVASLRGELDVRTQAGEGTTWRIRFPWPDQVDTKQRPARIAV